MRNFGQWITATPPEMEWIVNPGSVRNFQTSSHPLELAFCYPKASPGYPATIGNSWPFKNFMVPLPNDQETHTFTGGNRSTSSKNTLWASFLNRILVWQMNMTSHTSSHLRSWSSQDNDELNNIWANLRSPGRSSTFSTVNTTTKILNSMKGSGH